MNNPDHRTTPSPTSPSTVLVAGATGMLGHAVATAVRRSGLGVTSLSRDPARARSLTGVADRIVLGDATRPDTLRGAFEGVDAVISCLGAPMAFTTGDRHSFRDLDTVANLNLIRAARTAGVRRFVYVSLLVRPAWSHTVYARAHEEVVDQLASSGLSYGVVRPTGMFPIFDPFLTMARRGIAWIPGDGQARTNPVHPHEVAEACLEVLNQEETQSRMVGGPEILTRQEIVELAFRAVGRKPRILHLPKGALLAGSVLLRPVHPRLSEVTDFASRALTNPFIAPLGGHRRLADHFARRRALPDQRPIPFGGSIMTNPIHLVRDHPMVSFVVFACLFGWSSYIAAAFGLGSDPGNNPLGPGVAALVVVACQGRAGLGGWWRHLRTWRAAPSWYALALLAPLAVHLSIVLINHGLGAPLPTTAQLSQWPDLPLTFVVNLVFIGVGEESGWTAFAAPLLLRRHGLLGAWAILAGLRILWHVPLMLTGSSGWVMGIVGNAAFQLVLLQLFRGSGGRWSLAAAWHASLNTFGGSFFTAMVTGADQARYGLLLALYALLAIVALVLGRDQITTTDPIAPTRDRLAPR